MSLSVGREPLLAIIIPLYNKEEAIKDTIDSIITQDFDNYEIIVVDDGSTDNSNKIVSDYSDYRIKLIAQSNAGISAARNTGILNATAPWLLFLDADDKLMSNALNTLVSNICNSKTIIAGNFIIQDGNKSHKALKITSPKFLKTSNKIFKAWLTQHLILRAGSFIMPTDFAKKNLFDTQINRYEDLKFIFTCFNNLQILLVPQVIMIYERGYSSASFVDPNKWDKDFSNFIDFSDKSFWHKCALGYFLYSSTVEYPSLKHVIYDRYKSNSIYILIGKLIRLYSRILKKLTRILNIK